MSSPLDLNPAYSPFLYRWGQFFISHISHLFWGLRVSGKENIPPLGQGAILAANHRSLLDPPLVGCELAFPIFYFAKAELFDIPLLGWYIRRVNSFPVSRMDHDVGAFKMALRVLQRKEKLLLFPEGGRRLDPTRQFKAKAGVGLLAGKAQVPVIPVGIIGSDRLGKCAQLEVRFGRPLPPPSPEETDYQHYSDSVMQRVKELCHV